jgi:hypothetical protein
MSRISRRRFVKAAAGVVAAPYIVGSLARGQNAGANSRLGLGFIGMGTMNRGHLGGLLGNKDVQVLAVCDVDTTRRDAAKASVEARYAEATKNGTYKGCTAYNDFRELLARKDIDAVVIATPDHWHTIPCLEALKAGKDIYCEKPLTLTVHEGKVLIDAVRKTERVFQTGSQQRSSKEFWTACSLVRSGRLGRIKTVNVNVGAPSKPCDLPEEKAEAGLDWNLWLGPAPMRPYNSVLSPRGVHKHFPNWRLYREYSGGMMTDWGAHHFDIAQWGLGMDESGPLEIIPPADPKSGRGLKFLYAGGVEVVHGPGGGVQFIGENGEITVNRGKLESKPDTIIKEPLTDKDARLYQSPGHTRDWLNCIRSRKRPICHVEVGARSVAVCHLGNIGYWTGKRFAWDPAAWKVVGDVPEVSKWLDRERRDPWQLPAV